MVEFETININELKPAEYNPRYMPVEEMSKLRNNLETFGLVDPIIIDLTDNNTVIGGHQRLEVLKEIDDTQDLKLLRLGDVGLIFRETDLKIKDKNDQKALNLSLNKISGEWDYGKLDDLLLELTEDNYQIELTGFDEELLDDTTLFNTELFEESNNNSENTSKTEVERKIEENIEQELNQGVSEWDKQRQEVYDEYNHKETTNFRFEYKEGDTLKLGSHTLIIGDLHEQINKNFTLRFMDELLVTGLPMHKTKFIDDNEKVYYRGRKERAQYKKENMEG